MQAAAHTPGGFGGVPQSVGREFVGNDESESPTSAPAVNAKRAAGVLFMTEGGEVLMMHRHPEADAGGTWGLPGGRVEDDDGSLKETARREAFEETGYAHDGPLDLIHDDGQFATFMARVPKFDVALNDEHAGYTWAQPDKAPTPLHPNLELTFRVAGASTELDVARLISEGVLPSPQPYANMYLLALRITGTGLAFRSAIGEHVWRDKSLYLNDEFLARCAGLTVIMDHPDKAVLNSKEYNDRAIGSVMFAYIKGDEVWAIARIYDDKAMKVIVTTKTSTSPSVVFDETAGNTKMTATDGQPLLIEGKAFLLDHIAIVTEDRGSRGVWDKQGPPTGVEITNPEIMTMPDENPTTTAKADAATDPVLAAISALTGAVHAQTAQTATLIARVDAMEKNMPAPPLQTAADKKKSDDDCMPSMKAKGDSEGENPFEKKADKKKADAEGSDEGEEKGKSGEMKPDEMKGFGEGEAKGDDDDDDAKAKKADEEMTEMADAQAKADSVYSAFGKAASRPLAGERLMAYRKRLLRPLQAHSDAYKAVDLRTVTDPALLSIVEAGIFADAMKAARAPVAHADQLIEHRTVDRAGRTVSTFSGSVSAWLDDFKVAPQRAVQFNTPGSQRVN